MLWGWLECWLRWDLSSLPRRLIVVGGNWCLTAALIVFTPLSGVFSWSGYLIAGTFFTGWLLLLSVPLACVLMTATQFGGFAAIPSNWTLFAALMGLNASIGLAVITLSNRREQAVLRRGATFRQLMATQQENSTLQRHIVSQARHQGVLDERARLARELHDTMAQGLVAVVTQLEAIDDAQARSPQAAQRIERAKDLARQSLGEARRAVNALRPPALDDRGLPDALEELVANWAHDNTVGAQRQVSGDPRATAQDPVLVRVAQEALSNVARHARARQVAVTLTYLDDEVLRTRREVRGERSGTRMIESTEAVSERVRLIVVDDHPVVRDGIKGMLDHDDRIEVVGEARRWRRGAGPGAPAGPGSGADGPADARR